jgi:hypothetical protein
MEPATLRLSWGAILEYRILDGASPGDDMIKLSMRVPLVSSNRILTPTYSSDELPELA